MISTIIFRCGYVENCKTAPMIFSTHGVSNIEFTDPRIAMVNLASELYNNFLSGYDVAELDNLNSEDFMNYMNDLSGSSFDTISWEENYWQPFWLWGCFQDIKTDKFLYIPEQAEVIFSYLLMPRQFKVLEDFKKERDLAAIENDLRLVLNKDTILK